MNLAESKERMELQVPLDLVFERPPDDRQLVLWSTALHLLNLVYNLDWRDERKMQREILGAHARLKHTLEQMERWPEAS